jgi:hypothetical protein
MKNSLQILILLMIVSLSLPRAEDYVITINGISKEIGLDKETTLILPDGTSLNLTLHQKEYLLFTGDFFSFEHKNEYKPNRNDLGDGVFQTMIATPLGTGILVQEYMQMNPTHLVDFMLNELTKEEVDYGYKYSEEKVSKKVGDVTFTGMQAVTTYPGEEWTRSVLAYGWKDKGILIITFIEKDNYENEKELIEHLWESFEIVE